MFAKRLLYLTDRNARAYRWQRGKLTFLREFAGGDEPELEAFEAWLREERRTPLFIVADLIEIDFRVEVMPHASLIDAYQLRQRKLNSIYRSSPFRNALSLGREPDGRRDDRVLLSAITNPDTLSPWLPAIERGKAPLAGICVPPLLLNKTAKEWGLKHALLITRDKHSGLRLTYFFAGELRFSRLTPHLENEPQTLAPLLIEEVARTQQYLLNLRLLGRDDTLHIYVVDHSEFIEVWRAQLQSSRLLNFDAIDLSELAKKAQIPDFSSDASATDLYLALAAQGISQNHYGSGHYVHEAYLRLLRTLIQVSVLSMASIGVLIIAYDGFTLYGLQRQTDKAKEKTTNIEAQYQSIKNSFPPAPASAEAMREADQAIDKLTSEQASPRAILSQISKGLDAAPSIRLTRLVWRYGPPQETNENTDLNTSPALLPTPQTTPENTNKNKWHALIEGKIPHTIKQREALATVDLLIRTLSSEGITIEVLRLPYNIRPDAELKGESGLAGESTMVDAPLSIRITWNNPPKNR